MSLSEEQEIEQMAGEIVQLAEEVSLLAETIKDPDTLALAIQEKGIGPLHAMQWASSALGLSNGDVILHNDQKP